MVGPWGLRGCSAQVNQGPGKGPGERLRKDGATRVRDLRMQWRQRARQVLLSSAGDSIAGTSLPRVSERLSSLHLVEGAGELALKPIERDLRAPQQCQRAAKENAGWQRGWCPPAKWCEAPRTCAACLCCPRRNGAEPFFTKSLCSGLPEKPPERPSLSFAHHLQPCVGARLASTLGFGGLGPTYLHWPLVAGSLPETLTYILFTPEVFGALGVRVEPGKEGARAPEEGC